MMKSAPVARTTAAAADGGVAAERPAPPAPTPIAAVERPAIAVQEAKATPNTSAPFPATAAPATGFAETVQQTEGALAVAREPVPAVEALDAESLRSAVAAALGASGHSSAADLLGAAKWTVDGAALRVEVPGMGKKMLALTVNGAAEKIIRQELQKLGAPTRFLVVPGEGAATTGAAVAAPPKAGSIQAEALANPLVERAKEIFKAEVRGVVDLRQK